MKIKLLFISVFLWNLISFAQPYGNEWINYSQKYYQFKIVQEGIYKIDYQTLQSNGITPSQFSSANMQIFGRDKEQALLVFDGADGTFDPGDYFLFYAERNDGWLDSTLYIDPNTIGNPGYSLFNDTINYFFTWNTSTNNLRYTLESDNSFNSYTASPYVMGKSEYYRNDSYNIAFVETNFQLSQFNAGEGFSGNMNDGVNPNFIPMDFYFNTPNLYTQAGAPNALFHAKTNSNSSAQINAPIGDTTKYYNHHLQLSIGSSQYLLVDSLFNGYKQIITNRSVPVSKLDNNSTLTRMNIINNQYALTDYQSFSYMSLYYPRTSAMSSGTKDMFWIKDQASKIRIDFTGVSATSPIILVSGGTKPKCIFPTNAGGGLWQALISPSNNGTDQRLLIQDFSMSIPISKLSPVNGNATFTDISSINFEAADIIIYHPTLDSASQLYRDYRSLSYNVPYVNIEELYLQFGGGIEKHNAAIRRFAKFAYDKATIKPLALTLLGKGYNTSLRNDANIYNLSLIPGFGYPGSDICYTSNYIPTNYAPLIPTGRISVNTNTELYSYLTKLKLYESNQNQGAVYNSATKDWQKQVLHFVGGNVGSQHDLFMGYMNQFKSVIEDANYAGNVTTYEKLSSNPLDPSLLGKLTNQLQNGISLMNFFGHSSTSGFDLSIDEPENWNNFGKYPVVVGNGCHSGDIYSSDATFGEKLLRAVDEGAIAYVASAGLEYDNSVRDYCGELYNQFSPTNYGLPIGQQIQKTIETLQASQTTFSYLFGTLGATNLNGDPLLKLNWHAKPEIEITDESFYFNPTDINLNVDSIELNLVIKNLGKAITDTFYVEIRQDFPKSNDDSLYIFQYTHLNYCDTLSFKIPLQPKISVGLNTFSVKIDDPDLVPEQYDETYNNQLTKVLFLKLDAIVPVFPYEFAVVPYDTITVKASTINPIGPNRTYVFEMDTTDNYNSGEKRTFKITGLGGVKEVRYDEWLDSSGISNKPLQFLKDSTVLFWRTAVDSSELIWNETSFQYIKGKEGWGQDHIFQFKNNSFSTVKYDKANRKRIFAPLQKLLECDVRSNGLNYGETQWFIDNQSQEYGSCLAVPQLYLAVIDPITLNAWSTSYVTGDGGHNELLNYNQPDTCRARSEKYFVYKQDAVGLNNLDSVLRSGLIPTGAYIIIYTLYEADYSTWDQYCPRLYQTLASLGATNIYPGIPEASFIFFTQLGAPSKTQEIISTTYGDMLNLDVYINGGDYDGIEKSPFIGPSSEWKTLYWKQDPEEFIAGDTTTLTIEKYDFQGNLIGQIDTTFTHNDSIIQLSSIVDASVSPYIKLKAHYIDKVNFTPAQNDRWHVLYTPVPEAAIDGSNKYTWLPDLDTLNEGQEFKFAVDIKNISNYDMDSLLVSYWVEDQNLKKQFISYPRQDSLKVSEVLRDTITFKTTGMAGTNSLWVEVNPYVNGSLVQTDQLEQYHFNNLLQVPFYIRGDDVNPILDVTFNGRHILNGDIVDPQSEILISLKDDNEYLVMNDISDTTLFGIFLTTPDGIQKRIPFMDGKGNQVMQWILAEDKYKKFKIIYPALFEQDGIYNLQVQGADRSGNLSGDAEYKINFEVIHESSITYLMNYPNPFSTSTRFVFTLTGSEVPDEFLIQILTVSGKVVRQISEDELGHIYIGRNITEFAWDGTDDFGDPLANGVYIYRVLSRLNGEEIKHRESDGDKFFTKEYGKMYIIR